MKGHLPRLDGRVERVERATIEPIRWPFSD